MGMANKENRLKYICRKCFYRRALSQNGNGQFYYGNSRNASYCAYILIEDEPRGCTPTEGECARFKPRIRFDSTWGRYDTIK